MGVAVGVVDFLCLCPKQKCQVCTWELPETSMEPGCSGPSLPSPEATSMLRTESNLGSSNRTGGEPSQGTGGWHSRKRLGGSRG